MANSVYDYLVDIDPVSNEPKARLATDWTVSDDGMTYTFTLADGVTFDDGSPFTSADVVYTFDRLRNPMRVTVDLLRKHRKHRSLCRQ